MWGCGVGAVLAERNTITCSSLKVGKTDYRFSITLIEVREGEGFLMKIVFRTFGVNFRSCKYLTIKRISYPIIQ